MALSLDAAAEVFREAMRDTGKRYSLWYLIQGVLLIAAGVLAIIYPVISSAAVAPGLAADYQWCRAGLGLDRRTPHAALLAAADPPSARGDGAAAQRAEGSASAQTERNGGGPRALNRAARPIGLQR